MAVSCISAAHVSQAAVAQSLSHFCLSVMMSFPTLVSLDMWARSWEHWGIFDAIYICLSWNIEEEIFFISRFKEQTVQKIE